MIQKPFYAWQKELAEMVRDPLLLLKMLHLTPQQTGLSLEALQSFPLKVTRSYISRMEKENPHDPLFLQVFPHIQETIEVIGYNKNPLKEDTFTPTPGLLHKYFGRVLWLTSGCAIHCRYCFRRHFPYEEHTLSKAQWTSSLDYIESHPEIYEVILSGGDPLLAKDDYFKELICKLSEIQHLKTVRIHTRIPIVLPSRMTKSLLQNLTQTRLNVVIVIHANHPQEIDEKVRCVLRKIQSYSISLLNQSVLLKGINDDEEILIKLSQKLFDCGALPYYLHVLDPVAGTAHFDIQKSEARILHEALRSRLPGYLVPRLVQECPGDTGKKLL